jgi:uncharacterized delta-60 repeat protein
MKISFVRLFILGLVLTTGVFAQTGTLDPTFGTGGGRIVSFNGILYAHDIAIQADNKIILISSCRTLEFGYVPFCIARLNEDGTTDAAFTGGYPFPGPLGVYNTFSGTFQGAGEAVAVQADGKVIAAGSGPGGKVALVRYNSNGSLDSTFGSGGISLTLSGVAEKIAILPDGKIVVVGSNGSLFVARYLSDGALDNSFGSGGMAAPTIKGGSEGRSIAIQADGKIVVGGLAGGSYLLARFTADGSPDQTLDGDGAKTIPVDPAGTTNNFFEGLGFRSVGVRPDGRIVAVGHKNVIYSFNADGSPDIGFDADGSRSVFSGTDKETYAVKVFPDGRTLVVGTGIPGQSVGPFPPTHPSFVYYTALFNSDGTPDPAYGGGGFLNVTPGMNAGAFVVGTDPIGRVVIAGTSASGINAIPFQQTLFSAVRFLGPPAPVSIIGRVTTSSGAAVSSATVKTIVNGSILTARTNAFGYFNLATVFTGQTYTVEVSAKRQRFVSQNITVSNQFANLDFVAQEGFPE